MLALFAVDTAMLGMQLVGILTNKITTSVEKEETKAILSAKQKSSSKPSGSEQNIITGERPFFNKKASAAKRQKRGRQRQCTQMKPQNLHSLDRKTRRLKQKFPIQQPLNRR